MSTEKIDNLRALVLSDLHLGEEDSIFMTEEGEVNRDFLERLRDFIENTFSVPIPYLIIAGDGMDLSLARRRQAFSAFKAFLQHLLPLFSRGLIYLPGNHDHHLWVAVQEEVFVFQRIRAEKEVAPYLHALCPVLEGEEVVFPEGISVSQPFGAKTFLASLLPEEARGRGLGFLVAYPNLYVAEGETTILITHGHFFEKVWTLFTDCFRRSLARAGLKKLDFRKLEQINSPFIEFGWYLLGQAGALGDLLEAVWEELNTRGLGPYAEQLFEDLEDYLDKNAEFFPKVKKDLFFPFRWLSAAGKELGSDAFIHLLTFSLRHLVAEVARKAEHPGSSLRHNADILDSPEVRPRLESYLNLALHSQPRIDALIFGHTHRPFPLASSPEPGNLSLSFRGKRRDIRVYNTGGWITDAYGDPLALAESRPLLIGLVEDGRIECRELPWPGEKDFEEVTEKRPEVPAVRKRVKELVWSLQRAKR